MDTQVAQDTGSDDQIASLIAQQHGFTQPEAAPAARDEAGRFAAQPKDDPKAEDAKPAAETKEPAKEAAPAAEDDGEDYVELPPEAEGKEPARLKLSDLIASHKRAADLEAEVTKYKASPAFAPELEKEFTQAVEQRKALIATLKSYEEMMTPAAPDMRLADSDPVEFANQVKHYNATLRAQQAFQAERERLQKDQDAQTETLTRAKHTREFERAVAEFPDLKDEGTRKKLVGDAVSKLGLTEQEVISLATSDHRNVRMMRLSLEGLAARAAKETAAKVVAAKPKLVRAAARQSNSNGKAAQFEQAFGRVSQTHSIDDATRAIAALI